MRSDEIRHDEAAYPMDGFGDMNALILIVLLANVVLLVASWRITLRNRRSLMSLRAREKKANAVMFEAAVERGQVISLVRGKQQVA